MFRTTGITSRQRGCSGGNLFLGTTGCPSFFHQRDLLRHLLVHHVQLRDGDREMDEDQQDEEDPDQEEERRRIGDPRRVGDTDEPVLLDREDEDDHAAEQATGWNTPRAVCAGAPSPGCRGEGRRRRRWKGRLPGSPESPDAVDEVGERHLHHIVHRPEGGDRRFSLGSVIHAHRHLDGPAFEAGASG